ncbi:MAG: alpha/beta fold hydrolase [Candidatus Heimdallarchaeota archaeon]|nr:alpha/beta fold hydrolase [Candidatus Heimdallarchaeota archaeon]MDH5645862.1 alpha/beta fold hydrolase [Candidatus Heimdallarchaeota archaeon]
MRAKIPDKSGFVIRENVKIYYEVFGTGDTTILFLPSWSIGHSRIWKAQIPYFSRYGRVITFDGRGNGKTDRPTDPDKYKISEFANDAIAVMNETSTKDVYLVSLSRGSHWALHLTALYPNRIRGSIFIAPALGLKPSFPERQLKIYEELDNYDGWNKFNVFYWKQNYEDFLNFFFKNMFNELHSTKQIEDCVNWGLDTTPEILATTMYGHDANLEKTIELCSKVVQPVLVIHGDNDLIIHQDTGIELAKLVGGKFINLIGSGHGPMGRDPIKVNLLIKNFIYPEINTQNWERASIRKRRALYISSPIGLGHAQRDLAIANELRNLHPDLEIIWLAQHPVTKFLEANGEKIHPSSHLLSNESAHIEDLSDEHNLHAFQALREMDEILVTNFMVFYDITREENYDIWIGDESWELDYFLHENPELKTAPYVWFTDFVGYLPMPSGGEREAHISSDYNAEMISQIARYPYVRDLSIFVGNPDDIVPNSFGNWNGEELPNIREWTEKNYSFSGYVSGFDPSLLPENQQLRESLKFKSSEKICIVTVGGSGVGTHLLHKVINSFTLAKEKVPELRMIVVCGPRINTEIFAKADGLEIHSYIHNLYRYLAACDLAIVQGGLTTTMELTASNKPFIYFPLADHFEQNYHVRKRLDNYGAGRMMDFKKTTSEDIAIAIAEEIGKSVNYKQVETDGAVRAAKLISQILNNNQ